MSKTHKYYMEEALRLAQKSLSGGNPPVGALLVFEGKIIGTGKEATKITGILTDHAELLAIRNAIDNGHLIILKNSALYTTHEPCIMCSYAIRHYKIPQVIFGMPVNDLGGYSSDFKVLQATNIAKWGKNPRIIFGVLEEECQAIFEQFQAGITKS